VGFGAVAAARGRRPPAGGIQVWVLAARDLDVAGRSSTVTPRRGLIRTARGCASPPRATHRVARSGSPGRRADPQIEIKNCLSRQVSDGDVQSNREDDAWRRKSCLNCSTRRCVLYGEETHVAGTPRPPTLGHRVAVRLGDALTRVVARCAKAWLTFHNRLMQGASRHAKGHLWVDRGKRCGSGVTDRPPVSARPPPAAGHPCSAPSLPPGPAPSWSPWPALPPGPPDELRRRRILG
jgi:hypothetical protein